MNSISNENDKPNWIQKIKVNTFKILHAQLEALNIDNRLVMLLFIIEILQILYTSIHKDFHFLWVTPITTYLQYGLMYLSFQKVIQDCGQYFYIIFLSLSLFIVSTITICLVILTAQLNQQNKTTSLKVYTIKTLNYLIVLIRTVLTIPILQVILITFEGNNNAKYGIYLNPSIYYCCIVSASVSLFLFTIYSFLYCLFLIEISPFKENSISTPYNNNQLYKFGIKFINVLYLILDPEKTIGKYFIILVLLLSIFWCFKSYKNLPLYNNPQSYIYDSVGICLLWLSLCVFLQAFITPGEALGLYFTIIGFPIVIIVWIQLKKMKQLEVMYKTFKTINKSDQIEYYILTLVSYVKEIRNTEQRIKLEGILNYHTLNCKHTAQNCSCIQMNNYQARFKSENQQFLWYVWIKELLIDSIERYPRATRLYIIASYIQHQKLNNKYKGLFNLVSANESKPSIVEEFLSFHSKQSIEERMIEQDKKTNERKSVDINKFLEFNNKLLLFREILEKSVNIYIQFWNSLIQHTPNLEKIKHLGSRITNNLEESKQQFEKLCGINPNNLQCLTLYGNFLKQVVNDTSGFEKLNQQIKIIKKNISLNKNFTDEEKLKYGQNSLTGIIIIAGNLNNLGIIQNCNTQVKTIMGYYMSDLIGQNISRIMPKTIGNYHDEVLKNYLETSEQRFNTKQRFAPMINKEGFLVPCTIMTKFLPNLQDGIKLVGFFRTINIQNLQLKQKNPFYIFFKQENEEVQGLSENIYEAYSIKKMKNPNSNQINNQITIKSLFGWSFQDLKEQSIKQLNSVGLCTDLITMNAIPEEFNRNKGAVFKKQKILLFQKITLRYQGSILKLLYFFELPNDQSPHSTKKRITYIIQSKKQESININQSENLDEKQNLELEGIQIQINEEQKLLKEFKTLVGEKNEPQSIRALKRTGSLLFLVIIIMSIVNLVLYNQRIDQISEGNNGLYLTNTIISNVAEINYYARKLQILSYYQKQSDINFKNFNLFTANITNLLTDLQNNQFNLVKLQIIANGHGEKNNTSVIQWKLSQNGTLLSSKTSLDICLFDYITSASGLQTTNSSNLNFSMNLMENISNPTQQYQNLFNVRYSGLFQIISGQQMNSNNLLNFYYNFINNGQNSYLITLIITMCLIVLAESIAIPFIFSVVHINNRVLSLFGYIHSDQVQQLIYKCTLYLDEYLEDTPTGKIRMKRQLKSNIQTKNSEMSCSMEESVDLNNQQQQLKILTPITKKFDQQNEIERCEILMKSKDSSNIKILLQYSFFSLVFAAYFIQDYLTFSSFLNNTQLYYNVSSNLYKNINQIKKIKVYTLETVIDNSQFSNYSTLYNITYSNTETLYSIQRNLFANTITSFNPVFNDYFYYKRLFNENDLCKSINIYNNFSLLFPSNIFITDQCYSLGNRILELGLRPGIVAYIETSKSILKESVNQMNKNTTINNNNFLTLQKLQKYIENPSIMLLQTFINNFNTYMNQSKNMTIIKFAIFNLIIVLLFIFIWIPFLTSLTIKIWNTKGMLNMIPMQLVNKNEKLKVQFITGSILNSVK